MKALTCAAVLLASTGAGAMTLAFTHPYGELVDHGNVTVHVGTSAAWDCSSSSNVDLVARRITLIGGAAPAGPPINCFAPWVAVLPPLAAGKYEVRGRLVGANGIAVETASTTIEILRLEGRCNSTPGLTPTLWAVHKSLTPAELAQKVASDAQYAALLDHPVVGSSGIVSAQYQREFVTLTYPPLTDPTARTASLYESGDFLLVDRNDYVCLSAAPLDSVTTFIEYFHAGLDHYFYTGDAGEIAAVDGGKVGAWTRTGKSFRAVAFPGCIPRAADTVVYRFSGIPGKGPSSHFFTRDRAECYAVDKSGKWLLEGTPFYAAALKADGTCEASSTVFPPMSRVPLYRIWRPFGESNHRLTTDRAVVTEMVARGWVDEGPTMCVLAPGS